MGLGLSFPCLCLTHFEHTDFSLRVLELQATKTDANYSEQHQFTRKTGSSSIQNMKSRPEQAEGCEILGATGSAIRRKAAKSSVLRPDPMWLYSGASFGPPLLCHREFFIHSSAQCVLLRANTPSRMKNVQMNRLDFAKKPALPLPSVLFYVVEKYSNESFISKING